MLPSRLAPLCAAVLTLVCSSAALGSEPEPDGAPVQRPSGPPSLPPLPEASASAVDEASTPLASEIPSGPEVPEPEVVEPELASPDVASPEIGPAMTPTPALDFEPAGGADRWKRDYVRVQRPRMRGTGLMVTAGSLYATAILFQIGDWAWCGNCAMGLLERGFLAPAAVLAPIGAMLRGRHDAYRDTAARIPHRDTRAVVIAGASLAVVGAAAGLANEIMWWQCMRDEKGPYVVENQSWTDCRYGVGRATLDLSAAAFTTGLSMIAWGLSYRRDANIYRHARLTVAPQINSREAMLTVAGRF
jgi:hypothetical protein